MHRVSDQSLITQTHKMRALVRGLAASFADALTMEPLKEPINLQLARQQHQAYVELLRRLVSSITEVPADDTRPGTGASLRYRGRPEGGGRPHKWTSTLPSCAPASPTLLATRAPCRLLLH